VTFWNNAKQLERHTMTNQEKDLSATLHQKLGVVESRWDAGQSGVYLSGNLKVTVYNERIVFTDAGKCKLTLNANEIRNLESFLVVIGWRCQ
jgi:hypothetical protein